MSSPTPKLFQPYRLGNMLLSNRIVMNPMGRCRGDEEHNPGELAIEYYSQRASPGVLIIGEATIIARKAGSWPLQPGVWTERHIAEWKKITDSVHAKGGFMFCQLWALGRGAKSASNEAEGIEYVGAGSIPRTGESKPRPLTVDEIKEYVRLFGVAAKNAVTAGFDGVEVHAANGYLVDQFFQTPSNDRVDEYGGSVENRIRFGLEIADSIVAAIGAEKCAMRIAPWANYYDMGMPDPLPTFTTFAARLAEKHPNLAYLHVCEPDEPNTKTSAGILRSNEPIRKVWGPRAYVSACNHTRESALAAAEKDEHTLVGFGVKFLANPDLIRRLKENVPLNEPDEATYFVGGTRGYVDYPFISSTAVTPTIESTA